MTPHRWIRRKDGTVDLYIAGMIVGRVKPQHDARTVYWQGGYSGGSATSKAEAKRLVLRAVMAPRVKGDPKSSPGGHWSRGAYWLRGIIVGDIGSSSLGGGLTFARSRGKFAHFENESEARWWVEQRAQVKR